MQIPETEQGSTVNDKTNHLKFPFMQNYHVQNITNHWRWDWSGTF